MSFWSVHKWIVADLYCRLAIYVSARFSVYLNFTNLLNSLSEYGIKLSKIILRIFYCNALSKHKNFIFCFNLNLIVKCLFLSFFFSRKNLITVSVKLDYDIVLKYITKSSFSKVLADVGKKNNISVSGLH